jgi:hypothetical protein
VLQTHSQRAVDVFVVDTPRVLGTSLGVPSADAESTHVLCRHLDETTPDFSTRVRRRIQRIQQSRRVRALCYVVGGSSEAARSEQVLSALMPLLDEGSSVTVVGPSSDQNAVFQCIDAAMQHGREDLSLRAQFYDEHEQRAVARASRLRPNAAPAAAHARARAFGPSRHDGWFPMDPALPPPSDAHIH